MASQEEITSQLETAAESGDLSQVQTLVSSLEKAKEEPIDKYDLYPAFDQAIEHDHVAVARYLMDRGAEVDFGHAEAALLAGSSNELWQAMIDHGFDVNSKEVGNGRPLLHLVLGMPRQLKFFLEKGADPSAKAAKWNTTALDQCAGSYSVDAFKLLLQHGARLDEAYPLHYAALAPPPEDRTGMMAYLLNELKLDINGISHIGFRANKRTGDEDATPLHAAVRTGNERHIAFLLSRGADPSIKSIIGDDAFAYAKRWKFDDQLNMLARCVDAENHRV